MSKLLDLVDAIEKIATDLVTNTQLPDHALELYAKPPVITPELCPVLTVYAERMPWQLLATPSYYILREEVYVGWFVSASDEAESGGDELGTLMRSVAEVGDELAAALLPYSEGLPGQTGTYAKLVETTLQRHEGVVFGVVHRLELER